MGEDWCWEVSSNLAGALGRRIIGAYSAFYAHPPTHTHPPDKRT